VTTRSSPPETPGLASDSRTRADGTDEASKVVPLRHRATWVGAALLAVLVAMLVHALIRNDRFQWDVVRHYFTSRDILTGLVETLKLTLLGMLIAVILGTVLALMRMSGNPLLSLVSGFYVWFFRGTPLLVQVIFLYNISALYPELSLGIPFGPAFLSGNVNDLVTPLVAAVAALGLNEAAYMSEIVRAGITSVHQGQIEAAQASGMRMRTIMRFVVLPQAMRVIIPPTGNEVISMLKFTSLVSVIALPELLYSAQLVYARTYQTIPLLIVASLWYLIVTTVLTVGQLWLEKRFSRGSSGRRRDNWASAIVNSLVHPRRASTVGASGPSA
jgi:polar amino acid transport system permease protein